MKKWISTLLLASLTLPSAGWAATEDVGDSASPSLATSAPMPTEDRERFILGVEPLWLAIGEFAVEAQFRLGDHFTLGPVLGYMSEADGIHHGGYVSDRFFYDDSTTRTRYGLKGVLYFSGLDNSSAYGALSLQQANVEVTTQASGGLDSTNPSYSGQFDQQTANLTFGYRWLWGIMSLRVGGGLAYHDYPEELRLKASSGETQTYTMDTTRTSLALDAGLGISF